jgi:hypothetical protein
MKNPTNTRAQSSIIMPNGSTVQVPHVVPEGVNAKGGIKRPEAEKVPPNKTGSISLFLMQALVGMMLGDANMKSAVNVTAFFAFQQCGAHFDYLMYTWYILYLEGLTTAAIPVIKTRDGHTHPDTGVVSEDRVYSYFYTRASAFFFDRFFTHFYSVSVSGKPVKVVALALVEEFMSPVLLAFWLMDDGNFHVPEGQPTWTGNTRIATNGFSEAEAHFLAALLGTKLGLRVTVQENDNTLCIAGESMDLLRELVSPHMVPSMIYKLGRPPVRSLKELK